MSDSPAQPAAEVLSEEEQVKARAKALVKVGPVDPGVPVIPKPEEKKPAEKMAETQDAKPAADDTLDDDFREPPKEKKKDGPVGIDKALQNVQRQQADLRREMSELTKALQSGDDVGADEIAEVQEKVKKTVQSLRDRDLTDEADLLETVGANLGKIGNLEKRDKDRDKRIDELETNLKWSVAQSRYPNTAVTKVWSKAVEDAGEAVQNKFGKIWDGLTDQQKDDALESESNAIFHERCKAVEARHESLKTGGADPKPQTRSNSPAPTRTSAPSSTGTTAADVTPTQQYMERARRLVKKNE